MSLEDLNFAIVVPRDQSRAAAMILCICTYFREFVQSADAGCERKGGLAANFLRRFRRGRNPPLGLGLVHILIGASDQFRRLTGRGDAHADADGHPGSGPKPSESQGDESMR